MEITALPLEIQPPGDKPGGRNKSDEKGFSWLLAGIGPVSPDQAAQSPLEPLSGLAATTTPVQEAAAESGLVEASPAGFPATPTAAPITPGQPSSAADPAGPGAEAGPNRLKAVPDPLQNPAADAAVVAGGERRPHGVAALAALQAVIGEGRSGTGGLQLGRPAEAPGTETPQSQAADRAGGLGAAAAKPDAALAANRQVAERVLPGSEPPDRAPPPSPSGGDSASAAPSRAGGFDSLLESTQQRQPTAPARPADQLAVRIHHAVEAGQDRIQFRLHPAELGRIEVRLDFNDDGPVRAAILVERGEALDLLQRDSRLLERALQDAGIKTDQSSLSFDLREQNHGRQQTPDAGNGHAAQDQDEEPILIQNESGGTAQDYLRDGLLDITV